MITTLSRRNGDSLRIARKMAIGAFALLGLGLYNSNAFALSEVIGFGSNPGNLQMFVYVPSDVPPDAPLVVAMHGCVQSASSYDAETGWQKFAERDKFYLVLPQQKSANHQNTCFNWYESGDIARDRGEALSIKQMVDRMKEDYSIDHNRVFVTGLSAGGYMTNVMLATYPDVFAGGAPVGGGPYKCGIGIASAFSCMSPGTVKSDAEWGNLARSGYSGYNGPKPKVSIWHGDADYTVRPANLIEQMKQWTNYVGIDQTADTSDSVNGYPHKVYSDGSTALVETYLITGMGHGTPVDPGSKDSQCGAPGAYVLDANICSSYYIGRFWGIVAEADDKEDDDDGGGETGTLYCGQAANLEHYNAGRAIRNGVPPYENYSATGSYQWLGYPGDQTTLKETREGYFTKVSSC